MAHIHVNSNTSNNTKERFDPSPADERYLDGLQLGSSIDAITGQVVKSAIDPSSIVEVKKPGNPHAQYSIQSVQDITSFTQGSAFGFSSSITFPLDGLNVNDRRGIDFSEYEAKEGRSVFYILNWERTDEILEPEDEPRLVRDAHKLLSTNAEEFRNTYGDYFVSKIHSTAKFTVVWKCTAASVGDRKRFETDVHDAVKNPNDIAAAADFETAINAASSRHKVAIEIKFDTLGDPTHTKFDRSHIATTFHSFRQHAQAVPTTVKLLHHNTVDDKVPDEVPLDSDVYRRLRNVYGEARFIALLNSLTPGSTNTRLRRQKELQGIFETIHSQRSRYQNDLSTLYGPLDDLDKLRTLLLQIDNRQDLIAEVRALTHDDIKGRFKNELYEEDNDKSWITAKGRNSYEYGRTNYTAQEAQTLAVRNVLAQRLKIEASNGEEQFGTLNFPGNSKVNGTAVGIVLRANLKDGDDAYWAIPTKNALGRKSFDIEVQTSKGRGLDLSLFVTYIASRDYDEGSSAVALK